MSKSVLVNEYNKINVKKEDKIIIKDEVNVSLIDILSNREIEVKVNKYVDCLCKDKNYIGEYYSKCNKCNGEGKINLNGHLLVCNECKGEKFIRVNNCYLCNNKGKIVNKDSLRIQLNSSYKDNEILRFEYKDYILMLTLKIFDKDDYLFKGNDLYFLKGVSYSKENNKKETKVMINTLKGVKYVKSEFKVKKEIVKLDNCGIEDGDFYFIFDNEIENEKRVIYTNVLINKSGYVNEEDLINKSVVLAREIVALNELAIYIDEKTNEYENDEYIVKLNKLRKDDYIFEDDKLVYCVYLTKEDLDADKKVIFINKEKITLSYKKNLKEEEYVITNKVLVNKDGKSIDLLIKIIPYFENVYRITIKKNKNVVYIDDYKYDDYRLVETYKSSNYLENYIKVNEEEKIFINNDIVYIKRV